MGCKVTRPVKGRLDFDTKESVMLPVGLSELEEPAQAAADAAVWNAGQLFSVCSLYFLLRQQGECKARGIRTRD